MQTQVVKSDALKEFWRKGKVMLESRDGRMLIGVPMSEDNMKLIRDVFKPGRYALLRYAKRYGNELREHGIDFVVYIDGDESLLRKLLEDVWGMSIKGNMALRGDDGYEIIKKRYDSFEHMLADVWSYKDTHLPWVTFVVPVDEFEIFG